MKSASIQQIKEELEQLSPAKVLDLFLKVIKYKKESKELVSYLLFDAHDEAGYTESIKAETDEQFSLLPHATLHLTKKSLRKILRTLTKYARHINSRQAEVEIRLHFCKKLQASGIPLHKSVALEKIYRQQLKKIGELLNGMHEDLKYDYSKELTILSS